MNERIKELAEQAGFILHQMENLPDFYIFNKEKFAELIVEECASIYEGVYTDQQRPERIDKRIKQHFGIKK